MEININQRCKVELTALGATCYNKYRQKYDGFYPMQVGDKIVKPLWELMQIFGDTIYHGMPEAPFKDCVMEVIDFENV